MTFYIKYFIQLTQSPNNSQMSPLTLHVESVLLLVPLKY